MKRLTPTRTIRMRRHVRGSTLLETVISASVAVIILGTATGVYVTGTRRFYGEQSEAYVQFRTRTTLDRMASETRAARTFLDTVTLTFQDGTTLTKTASDGSSDPACLIVQVPAQDNSGILYWGPGTAQQNTIASDTIVYWYNATDKTLHRAVSPARNVLCPDGAYHSSYRSEEKDTTVAQNMSQLKFIFKDNNGQAVGSQRSHIASVDLQAGVTQTSAVAGGPEQTNVSVSGVRMRNQRSGSIYGMVSPVVPGVKVEAIIAAANGPYPLGTVVNNGFTDANGYYEVFGLEEGKYSLKFTAPSGAVTTVAGPLSVLPEAGFNNRTTTISQ